LTPFELETVRLTEERLVNVWPAVSTMLMDGWAVRFAHGYSSRANSASAVVSGAVMSEELIEEIERLYKEADLLPTVRITPLATPEVEQMLIRRGYHIKDVACVMTASLGGRKVPLPDSCVHLESKPSSAWLSGVTSREIASKQSADHLFAIVGQIRVPSVFATTQVEGQGVGFGMAALDRGWAEIGSVLLDSAHRGTGLGRATVSALLGWAFEHNAHHAFLQVTVENSVARNLYRSLGFEDLCRYRTLVKA
jgi:N-acetylglutamate synthase